MILVAQFNI